MPNIPAESKNTIRKRYHSECLGVKTASVTTKDVDQIYIKTPSARTMHQVKRVFNNHILTLQMHKNPFIRNAQQPYPYIANAQNPVIRDSTTNPNIRDAQNPFIRNNQTPFTYQI